jgi:hypothetical protein
LIHAIQLVITLAKNLSNATFGQTLGIMQRIVVIGQSGPFGQAWCRFAATRLAQHLGLPCITVTDAVEVDRSQQGWVAIVHAGMLPRRLLADADTAIWLHFSPLAVAHAWLRGLRGRLRNALAALHAPRLTDISNSLAHMAWTPHLGRLLTDSALAHLQVFHLRTPDETEFWLRLQEQRLAAFQPPLARAA